MFTFIFECPPLPSEYPFSLYECPFFIFRKCLNNGSTTIDLREYLGKGSVLLSESYEAGKLGSMGYAIIEEKKNNNKRPDGERLLSGFFDYILQRVLLVFGRVFQQNMVK